MELVYSLLAGDEDQRKDAYAFVKGYDEKSFKPNPAEILTDKFWRDSYSKEGYIDMARVIRKIENGGGVHKEIRGMVWEYLLGCYDPNTTFEQRDKLRHQRRVEYEKFRSEWKGMEDVGSDEKTELNEIWKKSLSAIANDVPRTDHMLAFYEEKQNQEKLFDILATYSWFDKEIGYCQGMNNMCSPIVIHIHNEADAFWLFERLMRKLRGTFKSTPSSFGVQDQLRAVSSVVEALDPELHHKLGSMDCGEYLFALRMLTALFREENSFADTLYLWEFMWAMEYNPNLFSIYESNETAKEPVGDHSLLDRYGTFERTYVETSFKGQKIPVPVFVVASLIVESKKKLMEADDTPEVNQVLRSGTWDLKQLCDGALELQKTYLEKVKVL